MNWRRGLLLAGVHLAVAGSLIVWMEARDAQYRKYADSESAKPPLQATKQEDEVVTFDLCSLIVDYSPQEQIIQLANIPTLYLTGWHLYCPPRWSLDGMLHIEYGRPSLTIERRGDFGLLAVLLIQWLLIGGFPLIQPKSWWKEPGAFIALCTVIALILVLIPGISWLARLPMLFALFAWFYWFGLLLWKSLRCGWWLVRQRTAATHRI